MFDRYGNYVLQTLLKVLIEVRHGRFNKCDMPGAAAAKKVLSDAFEVVAKKVIRQTPMLMNYTSGKSILRLVEDELDVGAQPQGLPPRSAIGSGYRNKLISADSGVSCGTLIP